MQTHTSTKHKSPIQYCMKQRRTMIHDDAIKAHSWDSPNAPLRFSTTLGVGQDGVSQNIPLSYLTRKQLQNETI